MAFRFFINVDKCLNMNNFDFFFYQKRSRNEFYLLPDVYVGEGTGLSFSQAASDIRMYLDRFPYNVGNYQIIIAMRSNYKSVRNWNDTLLSRLLDIDFALRQSNIIIRSGLGVQVAVNLIMLYETNVVKEIHAVDDPYMGSERLADDCSLLLKEIGVPEGKENDLDAIKEAWSKYLINIDVFDGHTKSVEDAPKNALYEFFSDLIKQYEKDKESESGKAGNVSTLRVLREVLNGYQIFELLTDKQNRDKDINTLLKVVEYSTTDFDFAQGMGNTMPLTDMCAAHWRRIVNTDDMDIQKKYAEMLSDYKERLSAFVANFSEGYAVTDVESILPETMIPTEDDISIIDSIFECEKSKWSKEVDPKRLVRDFKGKLYPVDTLLGRWEKTHDQISGIFSQLSESLEEYSAQLGKVYSARLNQRKADERVWYSRSYVGGEETKQEIKGLTEQEEFLISKLNQPQMTPSLNFQDQLNMEAALEQDDYNIRHYIRCIQSISAKNFFLMIVLIIGLVALLYGLLQTYNFESVVAARCFAGYIILSAVLLLFTWRMPMNYYWRKINQCLIKLEKEMDRYITGYFDRAKQLHEYINVINRLDYIERHIQLKKNAVKTTEWVVNARTWHINQARNHIQKLEFFSGLTATHKISQSLSESKNNIAENGPIISRNHIDDVIDNKLYWPQA